MAEEGEAGSGPDSLAEEGEVLRAAAATKVAAAAGLKGETRAVSTGALKASARGAVPLEVH